jgi:hypothetical protein
MNKYFKYEKGKFKGKSNDVLKLIKENNNNANYYYISKETNKLFNQRKKEWLESIQSCVYKNSVSSPKIKQITEFH